MAKEIGYNRREAVEYARQWALGRNPRYLDFEKMGGDCTNFASQCLLAGCGAMNYTPTFGWYYRSGNDRSPSWSGVQYLYEFLMRNRSGHAPGPYAEEVPLDQAEPGDLIQLGDEEGRFYHSPVVAAVSGGQVLLAAHSFDAWMRPLDTYVYARMRCLHITGARG
jgi:hypothetical protein